MAPPRPRNKCHIEQAVLGPAVDLHSIAGEAAHDATGEQTVRAALHEDPVTQPNSQVKRSNRTRDT